MPKPNHQFDLSIEDLDLIEAALRDSKVKMLNEEMAASAANDNSANDGARRIHDLLGRLHNQKTFYRPSKGTYVGG